MPARAIHQTSTFTSTTTRLGDRTVSELVAAARGRDRLAWEELTRRYGGLVRSVVSRYRMQEADAADAVQNTWLRAIERLDTLREPERLGAWLATTAGRECLAMLRRSRRERPDETVLDVPTEPACGPEAVVVAAEVGRAVVAAVAELAPQRRRLVNELFYLADQDYARVSRSMNMPVGSIGPTRGRAMATLRTRLERAGFGPQPGGAGFGPQPGGAGFPGGLTA